MTPILTVRGLRKQFVGRGNAIGRHRPHVRAVDGVDLDLYEGETLGIVGESGSGKSTLGRCVLRLLRPDAGSVLFQGRDVTALRGRELRRTRKDMQIVFQDPYSSLDPHMTIGDLLAEPLRLHFSMTAAERDRRVMELLDAVGLGAAHYTRRYPAEFSGGQRQRISIARALAVQPRLIVCDEVVSALDVSTQAEIINLFTDIQERTGVAYLFISHDLSVVRHISDRIAVMYLGRIVETGPSHTVHDEPAHPYTQALVSAVPVPDPGAQRRRERIVLSGDVPNPADPPPGCPFHPRCRHAVEVCRTVEPARVEVAEGHTAVCHLVTGAPAALVAGQGAS